MFTKLRKKFELSEESKEQLKTVAITVATFVTISVVSHLAVVAVTKAVDHIFQTEVPSNEMEI